MPQKNNFKRQKILGLEFFDGTVLQAVGRGLEGGLVVVPSAPVLVEIDRNPEQRQALLNADMAIADSGLMTLLWRVLRRGQVTRISGLEYLKNLLMEFRNLEAGSIAWVMPNSKARDTNLKWLKTIGINHSIADCYIAPQYSEAKIADSELLEWIKLRQPRHIVLALGGGTQERLGYYLIKRLGYRPGIHCIGAAIGFLSGDQVRIPMWADYVYLGWLIRCLSSPSRYVPRYWKAFRLVVMLVRYQDRLPPLKNN